MAWRILIPDRLTSAGEPERRVFGSGAAFVTPCAESPSGVDPADWRAADAVLAWHDLEYDATLIDQLDQCQILVRVGVGYDNVDLEAAASAGIPVCNVPDYGTNDVADHTLSLLLSLWRGLPSYDQQIRGSVDGWTWETDLRMRRLTGARMAIIGLGRIGTAVARRAKAFGVDVVAYDPYLPDGYEKSIGVERERTLEAAVEGADIVSFHTPLTPETKGLADRSFFERLDEGILLVNTARGEIVDLDALYKALQDGTVRSAGLDVLEAEPPDRDHPLVEAWERQADWIDGRVILTPHAAFYCEEALEEMRVKAAETARACLEGGERRNCVNERELANHGF